MGKRDCNRDHYRIAKYGCIECALSTFPPRSSRNNGAEEQLVVDCNVDPARLCGGEQAGGGSGQ